ncbi:hypothetical protein B484DRAFT_409294 [Ochromonadaceae sp. CCMP2298]|nr:hypothetical protein B484DRAFT_409294 [Ochromonadaceae sp. CCMP2298]
MQLGAEDRRKLLWLLTETFEPELVQDGSFLESAVPKGTETGYSYLVEVGPRLAFCTAWSSNCLSMLQYSRR